MTTRGTTVLKPLDQLCLAISSLGQNGLFAIIGSMLTPVTPSIRRSTGTGLIACILMLVSILTPVTPGIRRFTGTGLIASILVSMLAPVTPGIR